MSTKCCYCNRQFTESNTKSIDHIIPISQGGINSSDNIDISCLECNKAKSFLTLEEWVNLCKNISNNI